MEGEGVAAMARTVYDLLLMQGASYLAARYTAVRVALMAQLPQEDA